MAFYFFITAIATSENISLLENHTLVSFYFGPEVLIPTDNNHNSTEQCLEIGLDCMVKEHPSLEHGSEIIFEAVVETDFNITSESEKITLTVSMQYLMKLSPFPLCLLSFFLDCRVKLAAVFWTTVYIRRRRCL